MIQIQSLTMVHRKDLREIIQDLNLVVNDGDKLAIIGEEGNGKSSLLKYMMGDDTLDDYLQVTGRIQRHFQRYGYLAQSLPESQLSQSVQDYFFSFHTFEALDYGRLYQVAADLGLEGDIVYSMQPLSSLSGGERIKLQLLRLLLQDPEVLFLDEPSNDLDIYALDWLKHFIQTSDTTIVFVSHDESLLSDAATAILHLEILLHRTQARHTYQPIGFQAYRDERQRDLDHQDRIARKQREEDRARMARHQRIAQKVEHQLQNTRVDSAGRLLAKKFKSMKSQAKRFERNRADFVERPIQEDAIEIPFNGVHPVNTSKAIIQLQDVTLNVAERELVPNINFTWYGQEKIGIIGHNGVGKSTLLKYIHQHIQDKEGFRVGYMAQHYEDQLFGNLTPIDYMTQTGEAEEQTQIMTFLGSLRFTPEEMGHPIQDLSGGQRAKLLLAKLSHQQYNILLLDEPTRNISPMSQGQLRQTFIEYPGAILAVSHDRRFLEEVVDHVYELTEDGLIRID